MPTRRTPGPCRFCMPKRGRERVCGSDEDTSLLGKKLATCAQVSGSTGQHCLAADSRTIQTPTGKSVSVCTP